MKDVWVITQPSSDDCQCWRDAVCKHGWTWQEADDTGVMCRHIESYQAAFVSLADAVRSLWPIEGRSAFGRVLRERYAPDSDVPHRTLIVYVMPAGAVVEDDHDAEDGPPPKYIITRTQLAERGETRALAYRYRDS